MKLGTRLFLPGASAFGLLLPFLAGCARQPPPIPPTIGVVGNPVAGQALLAECLRAHGGKAAYERLHDVSVRYEGHWAALGPRLQPKLADTGYRGTSEERYLAVPHGFAVGQHYSGSKGEKWVYQSPSTPVEVVYQHEGAGYTAARSSVPETRAAARLVSDAYAMFLFGPIFFERRAAYVQRIEAGIVVDGRPCDEVLAILRPGFGEAPEDRVVLCIDRDEHLLRRVQFTLQGLDGTQGAEVHVDLMDQQRIAGIWWPTRFYEHIERPVNLPAHRWVMRGIDVNRGYTTGDLAVGDGAGFRGRAAAPAHELPSAGRP